jgi:hypothetical protein
MFRFTIRDVLWAMVVVGVSCGWYIERNRYIEARKAQSATYDELKSERGKIKTIHIGGEDIPTQRGKKMLVWFTEGGVGFQPAPDEKPAAKDNP